MTGSQLLQTSLGGDPIIDTLIDADFRQRRDAPSVLTPDQHTKLGDEAAEIERLTWTATKSSKLHQLKTRTLFLDGAEKGSRDYAFDDAGRRTTDGRWTAAYDELGRLTSMTSEADKRRIEYLWDPNNRLIGRIAKMLNEGGTWELETRTTILARDALPADTTFVWDPIVDRLVAIYVAGASTTSGATAEAGLLRQYLHADQGYDDPTRVVIAATPGAAPTTYFPILDEFATGSLSAVLRFDGTLIERVLYADPYGDAPRYLPGPVVDRITTEIKKNNAGEIAEVNIRVHLSDAIAPTTLSTNLRLAATRADHTVAYTSPITPTLEDRFTALWTLTAADWTALTTAPSAQAIEVAVHRDLRAEGWGETPVIPIPAWAGKIYANTDSTATYPVIVRDGIAGVVAFAGSVDAGGEKIRSVWTVADLYLVASTESKAKLLTGFKGGPFVEPGTGLVYLRDRWYDPAAGTFLTPDPESYTDSSNLYAAFAADPVNNSDPTGRVVPQAIGCAASVLIGWGITELTGGDYTWKDAGIDCTLGAATVGLSALGQLRHLRHANKLTRWGTRVGTEMALDIGAEAARREWKYPEEEYTWSELATGATLNAIIGEGGAYVGRKVTNRIRSALDFDFRFNFDGRDIRGIEAELDLPGIGSRKGLGILITSADAVNASFPSEYRPPYQPGTRLTEYTTTFNEMFVRVHGADNKARAWLIRAEAIRGLTAREIQTKYSLPELPEYVSDVFVPAGTRMRRGRVNAVFGGNRGATQYQLLERLAETAFQNTRKLRR
jgi:RHS repeat-associated protein